MPNDKYEKYEARADAIFGERRGGKSQPPQVFNPTSGASGVPIDQGVRPQSERVAGAHFLLSADEAVHDLLNLREIRDPERWLKRHRAPVAIDTGHTKRFLAAEILRWAADKFAPADAGRQALRDLADSQFATARKPTDQDESIA